MKNIDMTDLPEKTTQELQEARRAYNAIRLPEELPDAVQDAMRQARRECRAERSGKGRAARYAVCAAACLCVIFVAALNAVPVFAQELYGMPVLGHMARIFTLNRFEETNEESYVQVEIPAIENTGHTALEKRINDEIATRINAQVDQAKQRAKDYYTAYLETGGKKEEFIPIRIQINYDVKCNNGDALSFVVTYSESGASVYQETTFYNIDLETGKELTLPDLLGDEYIQKANEAVRAGIEADEAADPDNQYFHEEDFGAFTTITEDQKFFINEAGHVTIVFDKYEIAPGYMGQREFEVLP